MYHLKNKAGNVHKFTESKQKRDALLKNGYVEIPAEEKAPKAPKEKNANKVSGDAE